MHIGVHHHFVRKQIQNGANENLGWYLALINTLLMKRRSKVMGYNECCTKMYMVYLGFVHRYHRTYPLGMS
jgi:hypothetical protein